MTNYALTFVYSLIAIKWFIYIFHFTFSYLFQFFETLLASPLSIWYITAVSQLLSHSLSNLLSVFDCLQSCSPLFFHATATFSANDGYISITILHILQTLCTFFTKFVLTLIMLHSPAYRLNFIWSNPLSKFWKINFTFLFHLIYLYFSLVLYS